MTPSHPIGSPVHLTFAHLIRALANHYRGGNIIIDEAGFIATGKPIEVSARVVYEIAKGAIVRESAYRVATVLIQVDVLPGPPA